MHAAGRQNEVMNRRGRSNWGKNTDNNRRSMHLAGRENEVMNTRRISNQGKNTEHHKKQACSCRENEEMNTGKITEKWTTEIILICKW